MATIGTFKKSGDEFHGEIITLSVQTKDARIIPDVVGGGDNVPSHRIYAGRAEIGAAWPRRSEDDVEYLWVTLDDPSFNAPIHASLVADGDTFKLVWSRGLKGLN